MKRKAFGRSRFFQLYPLSLQEIASDFLSVQQLLPTLLVFGSYPQVFFSEAEQEKRLLLEHIRNAIISRFEPLQLRDDQGRLWENFCISERMKKLSCSNTFSSFYFWRTYDQQEIDLIEENSSRLDAFEFKWGSKPVMAPKGFARHYPDAKFQTIMPENVYDFLMT